MRFSVAAAVAALAGLASAYTQPVGPNPIGNSIIKPGLNEQVEAGKPYVITWTPSTPKDGNVALLLLRGPSNNVKVIDTIVDSTKNTGTFTWTPSTSLEADVTHYGIQLVVEGSGQYQYSTQFGIKNDNPTNPSSSSSSSGNYGYGSQTTSAASSTSQSGYPTSVPVSDNSTSIHHHTKSQASASVVSTEVVQPTNSMTVPATLQTTQASAAATSSGVATKPSAGAGEKVVGNAIGALAGLVVAAAMAL